MTRSASRRICRICTIADKPGHRVRRFALIASVYGPGSRTTRGAGGVSLCERCWRALTAGTRGRRQVVVTTSSSDSIIRAW